VSTIVIIHFAPAELYPPVQNLIRVLEKESMNSQVIVLTTAPSSPFVYFKSGSTNIKIIRVGKSGQRIKPVIRYAYYVWFYLMAFFFLVRYKPGKVLYFETISSFPAYLYKRFCNLKTKLFIHYHEYTSPQEYASGMRLTRYFMKHPLIKVERTVTGQQLFQILRKYRVQIDLLRPHNLDFHNMRTFEIPAAGGIQLGLDTPDHTYFFESGKGIFVFKNISDCVDRILAILALPKKEAGEIRSAARNKAINSHYHYSARAMVVLDSLNGLF